MQVAQPCKVRDTNLIFNMILNFSLVVKFLLDLPFAAPTAMDSLCLNSSLVDDSSLVSATK